MPATTISTFTKTDLRAQLSNILSDVVSNNVEVHVPISKGDNAVITSESKLNALRQALYDERLARIHAEMVAAAYDPTIPTFDNPLDMLKDIAGDDYDKLPDY